MAGSGRHIHSSIGVGSSINFRRTPVMKSFRSQVFKFQTSRNWSVLLKSKKKWKPSSELCKSRHVIVWKWWSNRVAVYNLVKYNFFDSVIGFENIPVTKFTFFCLSDCKLVWLLFSQKTRHEEFINWSFSLVYSSSSLENKSLFIYKL